MRRCRDSSAHDVSAGRAQWWPNRNASAILIAGTPGPLNRRPTGRFCEVRRKVLRPGRRPRSAQSGWGRFASRHPSGQDDGPEASVGRRRARDANVYAPDPNGHPLERRLVPCRPPSVQHLDERRQAEFATFVKSCAGVVRRRSPCQADSVSGGEAKQLSLFPGHFYDDEALPPRYTEILGAVLAVNPIVRPRIAFDCLIDAMRGISLPTCRCGDSYHLHQHYRSGFDCSFCRCSRYSPERIRHRSWAPSLR